MSGDRPQPTENEEMPDIEPNVIRELSIAAEAIMLARRQGESMSDQTQTTVSWLPLVILILLVSIWTDEDGLIGTCPTALWLKGQCPIYSQWARDGEYYRSDICYFRPWYASDPKHCKDIGHEYAR